MLWCNHSNHTLQGELALAQNISAVKYVNAVNCLSKERTSGFGGRCGRTRGPHCPNTTQASSGWHCCPRDTVLAAKVLQLKTRDRIDTLPGQLLAGCTFPHYPRPLNFPLHIWCLKPTVCWCQCNSTVDLLLSVPSNAEDTAYVVAIPCSVYDAAAAAVGAGAGLHLKLCPHNALAGCSICCSRRMWHCLVVAATKQQGRACRRSE